MRSTKSAYVLAIVILISGLFTDAALPEDNNKISGIEFLTGYGHGRLRSKENYRFCPLFVDLNFDLKKGVGQQFNSYPGLLQFVLEPFYSYVWNPDTNMEIGNNFVIKAGILPRQRHNTPQ